MRRNNWKKRYKNSALRPVIEGTGSTSSNRFESYAALVGPIPESKGYRLILNFPTAEKALKESQASLLTSFQSKSLTLQKYSPPKKKTC